MSKAMALISLLLISGCNETFSIQLDFTFKDVEMLLTQAERELEALGPHLDLYNAVEEFDVEKALSDQALRDFMKTPAFASAKSSRGDLPSVLTVSSLNKITRGDIPALDTAMEALKRSEGVFLDLAKKNSSNSAGRVAWLYYGITGYNRLRIRLNVLLMAERVKYEVRFQEGCLQEPNWLNDRWLEYVKNRIAFLRAETKKEIEPYAENLRLGSLSFEDKDSAFTLWTLINKTAKTELDPITYISRK